MLIHKKLLINTRFFLGGGGGGGGRLFEAGRLLTFPTYRAGAYSRRALIRGWALNRINTVFVNRANLVNRKLAARNTEMLKLIMIICNHVDRVSQVSSLI